MEQVKLHCCNFMWIKPGHACARVRTALDEAGVPYEMVHHRHPRGRRDELRRPDRAEHAARDRVRRRPHLSRAVEGHGGAHRRGQARREPEPVRTLLLVRHAPTSATRASAFPADEALDERGRGQAAGARGGAAASLRGGHEPGAALPRDGRGGGPRGARGRRRSRECDFGAWSGRSLADVNESEPAAVRAWMLDPGAAPHGGESLAVFCDPHRPLARRRRPRRTGGWPPSRTAR